MITLQRYVEHSPLLNYGILPLREKVAVEKSHLKLQGFIPTFNPIYHNGIFQSHSVCAFVRRSVFVVVLICVLIRPTSGVVPHSEILESFANSDP